MGFGTLSLKGRALRLLAQREHSRAELMRKLAPHAQAAADVDAVLDDLTLRGLLSDERYVDMRMRSRAARLFEELLTLPVAVPGLASALALILAYGTLQGFRTSFAFILVGHMVFTLPFMVRTVGAAFQRKELLSLEEAARSLGASFGQRFLGVLVPAVLPAIVAGSLMVFTLSVGEFNLTWMLHTPLTRTLPVGLADSYASMRIEIGSAYTLVFLIVILPVLWGLQAVGTLIEKHHGT